LLQPVGLGVPMGSYMLAATCFIGGLSFGGIGLLVASRARTVEAVRSAEPGHAADVAAVGVFFASSNFPERCSRPSICCHRRPERREAWAVMLEGTGPSAWPGHGLCSPFGGGHVPCRALVAPVEIRSPVLPAGDRI
jgi:hypothetical protein